MVNSYFSIFLKKRSCWEKVGLVFNAIDIETKDNLVLANQLELGDGGGVVKEATQFLMRIESMKI